MWKIVEYFPFAIRKWGNIHTNAPSKMYQKCIREEEEEEKKYAPNESLNVDILLLLYFEPTWNKSPILTWIFND